MSWKHWKSHWMKTENYNIYFGCLVVNCTGKGKMYLYDLVDIKKEAGNPPYALTYL